MSAEVLKTELVQVGQDSLQVVRQSGHGWVLIKAACEALGLDPVGQRQRLTKQPWAVACMTKATGSDGKTYEMFCLRSDKVAMWLATIDTSRLANDEARAKLVMWQCEAADVLDRWVRGEQGVAEHKTPAALPPGWSMRNDRVERTMSGIAIGDTVKARRFIESLGRGVPTGTKGVVVGVENGWFFVRFDGVQMTVSVIRTEIEKVEE